MVSLHYNKGGEYRRWYGNNQWVVNWLNDGEEIKQSVVTKYPYLNGKYEFVVKTKGSIFAPALHGRLSVHHFLPFVGPITASSSTWQVPPHFYLTNGDWLLQDFCAHAPPLR
jgi:hypothetical protein